MFLLPIVFSFNLKIQFYSYNNSKPEINIKETIEGTTSAISLEDFITPSDLDIYVLNVYFSLMKDVYMLFLRYKVFMEYSKENNHVNII